MRGGYCLGSLFFNLSCWSKFIIFRFIVLLTKDLCDQINLKLYQLTSSTSERFILCMKKLFFLFFLSARLLSSGIAVTILYNISCTARIFSFFEFFGVGKWFIAFYVHDYKAYKRKGVVIFSFKSPCLRNQCGNSRLPFSWF